MTPAELNAAVELARGVATGTHQGDHSTHWSAAVALARALLSLHASLPTAEEREALAMIRDFNVFEVGYDDADKRQRRCARDYIDRLLKAGGGT